MRNNKHFNNRIMIAIMVALMGIGIVSAQDEDTPPSDDTTEESFERRQGRGEFGFGNRGGRGGPGGGKLAILEATGLTREELREALQSGATLADILTDNGVDVEAFIDERMEVLGQRLDDAVAAGRITTEEAAERLEQVEERLRGRLNGTFERPKKDNKTDDNNDAAANL